MLNINWVFIHAKNNVFFAMAHCKQYERICITVVPATFLTNQVLYFLHQDKTTLCHRHNRKCLKQ